MIGAGVPASGASGVRLQACDAERAQRQTFSRRHAAPFKALVDRARGY